MNQTLCNNLPGIDSFVSSSAGTDFLAESTAGDLEKYLKSVFPLLDFGVSLELLFCDIVNHGICGVLVGF